MTPPASASTQPGPAWIRRAPNALSALRIGLAVWLPWSPEAARLPVVLVAGATDFLDGFLARRYSATSAAGGILDAVADKLFTLSAIATLAVSRQIDPWQAPVALARDAAVAAAFGVALARGRASAFLGRSPSRAGKWATAFFFLWFAVALADAPAWADLAVFLPAGALSLIAAGSYARALVLALREEAVR
ncbi:MAG: CDP-alcohol phosphatidyltransferase family protein [Planctomycetota bacterium]|nr:MAG: CDP-alcohol phosphatidyltransferase family protein [Planctomycetota bacterium]